MSFKPVAGFPGNIGPHGKRGPSEPGQYPYLVGLQGTSLSLSPTTSRQGTLVDCKTADEQPISAVVTLFENLTNAASALNFTIEWGNDGAPVIFPVPGMDMPSRCFQVRGNWFRVRATGTGLATAFISPGVLNLPTIIPGEISAGNFSNITLAAGATGVLNLSVFTRRYRIVRTPASNPFTVGIGGVPSVIMEQSIAGGQAMEWEPYYGLADEVTIRNDGVANATYTIQCELGL